MKNITYYEVIKSHIIYTGKVYWDRIAVLKARNIKQAIKVIESYEGLQNVFHKDNLYSEKSYQVGSKLGYKLRKL